MNMNMPTIYAKPPYLGQVYGIELEIEAEGLYQGEETFNDATEEYEQKDPNIPFGWLLEHEDSIVGVELISDQPYSFEDSVKNITRVFEDIRRQGYHPTRTPRGSTHIHANVSDLTWDQMKSFVLACAWAEPVLIEIAGKGRKGNLFAQSYETTPMGWQSIIQICRRQALGLMPDTHYMATSFHPINTMGSVEFRMGPSSRNASDAIEWLEIINHVVQAGRNETISGLHQPDFLERLLLGFNPQKQFQLQTKGARHAAEVFYAMSEPYEAPATPKKKLVTSLGESNEQLITYHELIQNTSIQTGQPVVDQSWNSFIENVPQF
jgi:hypothetical protein